MSSEPQPPIELTFTKGVVKQINSVLRGAGPKLKADLDETLDELKKSPLQRQGSDFIKHLHGNQYRAKVGYSYRLKYSIKDDLVELTWFGHRKEAYRR